jgi:dynein light chain Tctex-type 1
MGENIYDFGQLSDYVTKISIEMMSSTLESKRYNPIKVGEWIDTIGTKLVSSLRDTSPNFKYIVNVVISQKTGAGLHCDTVACWDANSDAAVTTKFESETMLCLCTIIGIAL